MQHGVLSIGSNQGLGTGDVTINGGTLLIQKGVAVANEIHLAGGSLFRQLAANTSLAGVVNSTSDLGGRNTTAQILEGTLTTESTLTTSFSASSTALNDEIRMSDVYHLAGTGTDIFVLQLSMTDVTADSFLGWLNTNAASATYNQWVNAVEGNTGDSTAMAFQRAYNSATDFHLGYYGVDLATGTVWAVVNHNSDFAIGVVPEPSTWALLVLGGIGFSVKRYRRLFSVSWRS